MTPWQCSHCGQDIKGTIYQVRRGTSSDGYSGESGMLCALCLCVYVQKESYIEVPIIKILHAQRLSSALDIEVAKQTIRQLQQLLGDISTPELSPEEIKKVKELLQAQRNLDTKSIYDH